MTPILLAAIAGFIVGGFVGMVAIAIMCRGSDADEEMDAVDGMVNLSAKEINRIFVPTSTARDGYWR